MKKITLALSLAGLAGLTVAGAAIANEHASHHKDPFADKTITRADVADHAGKAFARFDANSDGKLDEADRAAHMGKRFEKADTNNDGAVSRDEFNAAHAEHQGKRDGMEGEQGMKRGGGHGMAMMMLHMADTNKDRTVSREEFIAAHQAMFDRADTDKNGQVTPAERKAAHAKMREHMKEMKTRHGAQGASGHEGH